MIMEYLSSIHLYSIIFLLRIKYIFWLSYWPFTVISVTWAAFWAESISHSGVTAWQELAISPESCPLHWKHPWHNSLICIHYRISQSLIVQAKNSKHERKWHSEVNMSPFIGRWYSMNRAPEPIRHNHPETSVQVSHFSSPPSLHRH